LRGRAGWTATVAAVAALTAAAGCSASSGTSPAASARTQTASCAATPGVTSDSIKLGLLYSDSGGLAAHSFQFVRSAVNARVGAQNAAGGVGGRQIEIVWQDDQSSPANFAFDAHQMVNQQGVFGLVVESVAATGPTLSTLSSENIPVTGIPVGSTWSSYPNMFSFGSLFNSQSTTAVDTFGRYVKGQGGTRAYVLADPSTASSTTVASEFAASLTAQGITVAGQATYTPGTAAHVVDALRRSGADTLAGALQPNDFADVYAAAKAAGLNLKVALSAAGYDQELLNARGKAISGMSVVVGYTSFEQDSAPILAYQHAVAQYSPEIVDPNQEAALSAWVSADEMITGLKLAGACPTRTSFISALRKDSDYTAGGLIAPTDLTAPTDPATCFNFVKANDAGTAFEPIPAATLDTNGFWCGEPIAN
jgi:ABC-type branched-subunit amino acid transport system substrate-binding protein